MLCWWAGGWGFVVWGVAARVFASAHGHWLIGWLAHNRGAADLAGGWFGGAGA